MPGIRPHDHSPEAIARRLSTQPSSSYLRDWVYGGVDGAVTTFAVVSGVVGANLGTKTILILGVANLVADGFSMAAGNYLGTRSEHDELKQIESYEHRQVRINPEGEREEVRQILIQKGFQGELLEKAVELFTSDRDKWVQMMVTEEYGLPANLRSPIRAAVSTFSAFAICGAIPLLPYAMKLPNGFTWSCFATGAVFFGIGSLKSRWSLTPAWRSGLGTLLIGAMAAALSYGLGHLLNS